jgi:peptidoglycan/xylan/chitin deacetylase (PgdA/CDA1 family)
MSWDQVAELDRLGHEIGAHTVNHVDLGEVVGDAARREIVASRDEIQDRLGTRVDLFAYPYGREHQMTDRNREILREEGFRCCVSCFGGRVPPGEDPFRMKREPISPWYEGTGQFVFDVVRQ